MTDARRRSVARLLRQPATACGRTPRRRHRRAARRPIAGAAPRRRPRSMRRSSPGREARRDPEGDERARRGAQQCWARRRDRALRHRGRARRADRHRDRRRRRARRAVDDTTRNAGARRVPRRSCSRAYPWAPPLHGQTIQLPFKFRAPDGQNVIDRPLVPCARRRARSSVAVLLDENEHRQRRARRCSSSRSRRAARPGCAPPSAPSSGTSSAPATVDAGAAAIASRPAT